MIFLDPTSDIAFKRLFGDITHKKILISFLNSILQREEGSKIVDVVINDPHNTPETFDSKASIVDVRCTDQSGFQYIVEMQVSEQKDYGARAQYYSALALSRQLQSREKYDKLVPVIFVGILDFKHLDGEDYLSRHLILNTKTQVCSLKHLEFYFIELKKFHKTIEQLDTILDKWIYFLKHAVTLNKVPASMQEPVLQEAFGVLEQGNWSNSELEAYDRYLDAMRSYKSQLETAELKGELKGELRGELKGSLNKALDIAQELLKLNILDDKAISKATGLSIKQIEELKKSEQ